MDLPLLRSQLLTELSTRRARISHHTTLSSPSAPLQSSMRACLRSLRLELPHSPSSPPLSPTRHVLVYTGVSSAIAFVLEGSDTLGSASRHVLHFCGLTEEEYAVCANEAKGPLAWKPMDLSDGKTRGMGAIQYLTALSFDNARGKGMNGLDAVLVDPGDKESQLVLPPLYLIRRKKEFDSQSFRWGNEENNVLLDSSDRLTSKFLVSGAPLLGKQSKRTRRPSQVDSTVGREPSVLPLEDLDKGLEKHKNLSHTHALMQGLFSSINTSSQMPPEVFKQFGSSQKFMWNQEKGLLEPKMEESDKNSKVKGGAGLSARRFFKSASSGITLLPGTSPAPPPHDKALASPYEAFAALMLFNGEEIDQDSTTSMKNINDYMVVKAADLLDFTWLGRRNHSDRLSCRAVERALKLSASPGRAWMEVFSGVVSGTGDRLAHTVSFDEFRARYSWFRKFPLNEKETFGEAMDALVSDWVKELKKSFKVDVVPVPTRIWYKRVRAPFLITAFALLIATSVVHADVYIAVANSLPLLLPEGSFLTDYVVWADNELCNRLNREDVQDVVARLMRIALVSVNGPCVNSINIGGFPQYSSTHRDFSTQPAFGNFSSVVPNAREAHGRFSSNYEPSGSFSSYGAQSQDLNLATRALVVDFEVKNFNLNGGAHATVLTEFDWNGKSASRVQLTKTAYEQPEFYTFIIVSTAFVAFAFVLPLFYWLQLKRQRFSQADATREIFTIDLFACAIVVCCVAPMIAIGFNSNLMSVSLLFVAFCVAIVCHGLERSWFASFLVFHTHAIRLLSIVLSFAILVIGYSIALDGWGARNLLGLASWGQVCITTAVYGLVPRYTPNLFSVVDQSKVLRDDPDGFVIVFGTLFIIFAAALHFAFVAIVAVGLDGRYAALEIRRKLGNPAGFDWGFYSIFGTQVYRREKGWGGAGVCAGG